MKQSVEEFSKITAILRGYDYAQVEITLNHPDAKDIIRRIVDKFGDRIAVGAGTVLSAEDLQDVVEAGVDFVLAPSLFSRDMLNYCRHHQVISVPGALSPSEVYQCVKDGADIIKIFPAGTVGSKYFKDIQAPFGPLPLMAVGGIHAGNIAEYLHAGASYVGIASGLFRKEDIAGGNTTGMQRSLEEFALQMEGVDGEQC